MANKKKIKVIRPLSEIQATVPKLKVCAYCRVSTEQEDQDTSYESQKQYYEKLIKSNPNWEFVKIYADKESGRSIKNRHSFIEMLEDCENGEIDLIITKSISRFARNTLDTTRISRTLRDRGIYIKFEKENINTENIDSELAFNLMAGFAQMESESISKNIKVRIVNSFKQGEILSKVLPYGYEKDENKNITIAEHEAQIVKRVFELCLQGVSIYKIAQHFDEIGVKTRKNNKWKASTLSDLIKNDFYIGTLTLQKKVVIDKKLYRNKGIVPKYIFEDNHEGIISKQDFEKANQIVQERVKQMNLKKVRTKSVFTSKIECENCGVNLIHIQRGKAKSQYMCKHCFITQVRTEFLKEKFVLLRNDLVENYEVILNSENLSLTKEKKELNSKYTEIKKQRDILYRLKQDNVIDSAIFIEKNNQIDNELLILEQENEKFKLNGLNRKSKQLIKYLENLKKLELTFNEIEFENIIEKVIVVPNIIKFILKTGHEFEYTNFFTINETRMRYGYTKINGEYTINQYESDVLNFIFDEFINGKNLTEITKLLEEKKLRTKRGMTKWSTATVGNYLYNEKYLGTKEYPQVISNEKFEKVQEIQRNKRKD